MSEDYSHLRRSCKIECNVPIDGETTGVVPTWLNGTFLRNGPGLMEIGETQYNHAFDGLALLHRFHIEKGYITYSNKFLQSDRYQKNMEANRIVFGEFGTAAFPDPCKSIWQRFMSKFQARSVLTSDNCNITICPYGDKIYTATESNIIHEVDSHNLNTLGKINLTNYIAVNHATAHIHVELDGTVYNMGNSYSSGPYYNIIKFPPPKETENKDVLSPFQQASIIARIPSRWKLNPGYYHSFSITDNYILFIEQPLCISLTRMFSNLLLNKPLGSALSYYSNEKARFHLVRKDTGAILDNIYLSSIPFMFFHTINAFEDEGHIVLDVSCYNDDGILSQLSLKEEHRGHSAVLPKAYRFVFPINIDKSVEEQMKLPYSSCSSKLIKNTVICHPEIFDSAACELCRINYHRNGKNYRYFYGMGDKKLIKADWQTKTVIEWHENDQYPSEPVFVKSPDAQEEDDGVVLCSLQKKLDPNCVTLLILDGKSFTEISRTTFVTKSAVPFTFHGLFSFTGASNHLY